MMEVKDLYKQFCVEGFDENGILNKFELNLPDNFNFGYDIIDAIAKLDPKRPAMIWCDESGKEIHFTYDDLMKIDQLSAKYKDCDQLRKIAIERGAEHFLVKMVNQSQTIMPQKFEEDLLDFSIQDINKLFKVYHTYYSSEIDYDYIIRMNIRNIQFSPEREKSRVYEDIFEETIEKEQNHKSERDTISKEKTEKLTVRHTATIEEVLQQKTVALTGDVEWFNVSNNEVYYSRPVEVEAVYENIYGRLIKGDRKYLNDDTKQKLSRNPRPFPTHEEMLHDAGIQLKKKMKGIIFDKES